MNVFFWKCIKNKNFELKNAIARFDDYPVNNGHLEIISKRHVKDWWETTIEEKMSIVNLLDKAKEFLLIRTTKFIKKGDKKSWKLKN